MADELLRVPVDPETLARLRAKALAERRATGDEASIILTRVLARRARRHPVDADDQAPDR